MRYPAQGRRGSAFSSRAAGYGAFGGAAHTERSNAGIALIVMVETPEGVENAAAMAAVEDVDAVLVGPIDLSHSMGLGSSWGARYFARVTTGIVTRALKQAAQL